LGGYLALKVVYHGFHFLGNVLYVPFFSTTPLFRPDTSKREHQGKFCIASRIATIQPTVMNSEEAESILVSVLEQNLARAIELQRQAAVQEQLIRQRIREGGHVEPDSLLVLTDDALRRTMGYLPPKELANVEVCRRVRSANVSVWDGLVQHKYPTCKLMSGKSSKEKILIHLHTAPGRSSSRHMIGRPIKISGSPFATIPSMSGLNRSSSPSFSTSYNYMHSAQ
jgi:hypothetical protein